MSNPEDVVAPRSCGNVFQDLGLPEPEERLAKAQIAYMISSAIRERGLTQVEAARILGIDQPGVSRLQCGKLSGFTLDRLFRFLNALDMDVEVTVARKAETKLRGTVRIRAVA